MAGDLEQLRRVAVEQWALPVAFRSTIEAMYADGVRIFLEVGLSNHLTGFVEETLRDRPHFAVSVNVPGRSGLTQLNHVVASLFAQGVGVETDPLYVRRRLSRIDLERDLPMRTPRPPLAVGFPEMRLSPSLAARLRSQAGTRRRRDDEGQPELPPALATPRPANGLTGPPEPVREMKEVTESPPPPAPERAPGVANPRHPGSPLLSPRPSGREGLIGEHLRTVDAFLDSQRRLMGAYRTPGKRPTPKRPARVASPDVSPPPPSEEGAGRTTGGDDRDVDPSS
jgi:hypothetical protein